MPTGYTAAVQDGKITELEPFVMQLARGMGALITMRDDPWDAPVPEKFEPSDYHSKAVAAALSETARLKALSLEDCAKAAKTEAAEYDESVSEARAKHVDQRRRYESMIAKVQAWAGAPEGIKEFALQQLTEGMKFDCSEPFTWYGTRPSEDGGAWRREKLAKAERDVEYHSTAYREEVERVTARNAWLAQLRESLK